MLKELVRSIPQDCISVMFVWDADGINTACACVLLTSLFVQNSSLLLTWSTENKILVTTLNLIEYYILGQKISIKLLFES